MKVLWLAAPAMVAIGSYLYCLTVTSSGPCGPAAHFMLRPIGHVKKAEGDTRLVIEEAYEPGLKGLGGFSHVWVFWWFDRNNRPEKRSTLQVHPRGDRRNPLTGVFATRAPVRPNPIALTLCRITSIEGNTVRVDTIGAFDGTPVLDLKPYIPESDSGRARVPEWVAERRSGGDGRSRHEK